MTSDGVQESWKDFLALSAICVAGVLLAAGAFFFVRGYYQTLEQQRFRRDATYYATSFKDDVARHVSSLAAIRAFVSASRGVSRWEFSAFAEQILPQNLGFRAILWVPRVAKKDRLTYEMALQQDGLYGLRIRELTNDGSLVNAGDRNIYFPISYVEPFDNNDKLVGVDLSAISRYAELFHAALGGHVAASAPFTNTLVAGTRGPAVLLAYPLRPNNAQRQDIVSASAPPEGYALGVLQLQTILEEALGSSAPIQAAVAYDEKDKLQLLTAGTNPQQWLSQSVFHEMEPFDVAGRHFDLVLRSAGRTDPITGFYVPAGISLLILALTALLAQNICNVVSRKRLVERAVVSRTAQLRAANETLHSEVQHRRQTEVELRVARDKAQSASRAKSAFMASMSHELRTPLNAIIGFSSILAETKLSPDPRQNDYAREILASGRRLLDLINDILDLTLMETGPGDCALVYLSDCVDAALAAAQPLARANGVSLKASLPEHLPPLLGDSKRITKALLHLVFNAIKFTPEGGAAVIVAERTPTGALSLEVIDTGVGMPPQALERISEGFSQHDGRLGRRYEGVGLGLTYVGKVAELHEGALDVFSEQGHGTRVRMTFQPRCVAGHLEVA